LVAIWVDLPAVLVEDEEARPVASGMVRLRIVPPDESWQGGYFANYVNSDGIVSIRARLGSYIVGRAYDLPKNHIDARNLLQYGYADDVSSEANNPFAAPEKRKFQPPKANWIPLHLGPIHFRSFSDGKDFVAVEPLDALAKRFQWSDAGQISIEEESGAVVIAWDFDASNGIRVRSTEKHFGDGPHRFQLNQIDDARARPRNQGGPIGWTASLSLGARNLFCGAVSLRNRMIEEFRYAVDARHCKVFARVDSPTAPFTEVPADVFRRYRVTSWGVGTAGGGEAELAGEPKLFAIHLEPVIRRTIAPLHQRAATIRDIERFKTTMGDRPHGIKELDIWQKTTASDVSRESLRNVYRQSMPPLKRGPRGARKISAR
jgi:hypothetical protein